MENNGHAIMLQGSGFVSPDVCTGRLTKLASQGAVQSLFAKEAY